MSKHRSGIKSSDDGGPMVKPRPASEERNGSASPEESENISRSRKRKQQENNAEELEIDVSAPEPLSKKALRRSKKQKLDPSSDSAAKANDGKSNSAGAGDNDDEIPSKALENTPGKRSSFGIWIGNLPFVVNKAQLREFLISKGAPGISEDEVTRIHIPAPSNNAPARGGLKPKNKGFAYVDFASAAGLEAALSLSETSFGGRRVLIKDAKSFEGRPDKADEKLQDKTNSGTSTERTSNDKQTKRIFVGNLGFDVTRSDLQDHFVQCGALAHVHIATFEDTGKCKGYAWVTFEDAESAETAVRGWILKSPADDEDDADQPIADDNEDNSTEQAQENKKKSPKPRKWFVNRLFGRMLRCEFAEDPATRYKKRFGKQARGADVVSTENSANSQVVEKAANTSSSSRRGDGPERDINPGAPTDRHKRRGKSGDQAPLGKQGNAPNDISYRTGAVVSSTGTKTTFD